MQESTTNWRPDPLMGLFWHVGFLLHTHTRGYKRLRGFTPKTLPVNVGSGHKQKCVRALRSSVRVTVGICVAHQVGEDRDERDQRNPCRRPWVSKCLPVGISYFLFPSFLFLQNHQELVERGLFCQKSKVVCAQLKPQEASDILHHGSWACGGI